MSNDNGDAGRARRGGNSGRNGGQHRSGGGRRNTGRPQGSRGRGPQRSGGSRGAGYRSERRNSDDHGNYGKRDRSYGDHRNSHGDGNERKSQSRQGGHNADRRRNGAPNGRRSNAYGGGRNNDRRSFGNNRGRAGGERRSGNGRNSAELESRSDRRYPPVPDDVMMAELDKEARVQLKTLTKENANWVAGHLVMASRLINTNPELAHEHALAAKARAARVAVVRETLGVTAYETGDYALALRELRTFRRISGSEEQIALMVDCERGLGRTQDALELAQSVDPETLSAAARVALAVVKSGVRLDLGQQLLAREELQIPELNPDVAYSYSPMLFHAYATVLEDLGEAAEASEWLRRADVAEQAMYGDDDDDEVTVVGLD